MWQDGRVGVDARGVGEDKRMGAVKSVNRGALLCSSDALAACPTWLVVIRHDLRLQQPSLPPRLPRAWTQPSSSLR